MDRNYTNIEQSKELLKLGLNPDTADMYYTNKDEKPTLGYNATTAEIHKKHNFLYVPCWSTGALKALMPDSVNIVWFNGYEKGFCGYIMKLPNQSEPNLFDNEYELIVWLLENDYKLDKHITIDMSEIPTNQ